MPNGGVPEYAHWLLEYRRSACPISVRSVASHLGQALDLEQHSAAHHEWDGFHRDTPVGERGCLPGEESLRHDGPAGPEAHRVRADRDLQRQLRQALAAIDQAETRAAALAQQLQQAQDEIGSCEASSATPSAAGGGVMAGLRPFFRERHGKALVSVQSTPAGCRIERSFRTSAAAEACGEAAAAAAQRRPTPVGCRGVHGPAAQDGSDGPRCPDPGLRPWRQRSPRAFTATASRASSEPGGLRLPLATEVNCEYGRAAARGRHRPRGRCPRGQATRRCR